MVAGRVRFAAAIVAVAAVLVVVGVVGVALGRTRTDAKVTWCDDYDEAEKAVERGRGFVVVREEVGGVGRFPQYFLTAKLMTVGAFTPNFEEDTHVVDVNALELLVVARQGTHRIRAIVLVKNNITQVGAHALGMAINASSPHLRFFYLVENRASVESHAILVQALGTTSSPVTVGISGETVTKRRAAALARMISARSAVVDVVLCHVAMSDDALALITNAVADGARLRDLLIEGMYFSERSVSHLVHALASATFTMENLSFWSVALTDASVKTLFGALSDCPSGLQSFGFASSKVGDSLLPALADALPKCSSLTTLNLNDNMITDVGLSLLSASLAESSLIRIQLSGNVGITDKGAEILAEVIDASASLAFLLVSGTSITDAGALKLAGAVRRNPQVELVGVRNCEGVSQAGLDAIEKAFAFAREEREQQNLESYIEEL